VETIGSKRSYALIWCMPNNDDDDAVWCGVLSDRFGMHVLGDSPDMTALKCLHLTYSFAKIHLAEICYLKSTF